MANRNLDIQILQDKISKCISSIIKPLRILQFFTVVLLFAFTIYMIVMDPMPLSSIASIFLIVLSGIYVFVLAVELITYFDDGSLHAVSMAIFSLLGLLSFGIAGLFLIFKARMRLVVLVTTTLCLVTALLFLIDAMIVLVFWKRKCSVCKRCCYHDAAKLLSRRGSEIQMRRDVTTSLSDVRISRELDGIAMLDHYYRKVEYPRRRQYVDCPTCVPSVYSLDVAQIQTEPKKVSIVDCQTPRAITREAPIQTSSRCEFCHQQILPLTLPITDGAGITSTHCFQHPQWSYPYPMVQFVRGAPCCSKCKCTTPQMQPQLTQHLTQQMTQQLTQPQQMTQQMTQQLTQQRRSLTPKVRTSKMCETTQQNCVEFFYCSESQNSQRCYFKMRQFFKELSNNDYVESGINTQLITKTAAQPIITSASFYGSDQRKNRAATDVIYKQKVAAAEIKDKRNIDQRMAEESKFARTRSETERSEEKIREITIGGSKIERSKGGGEHCAEIFQEFMRTTEQGNVTNLEESSMHTNRSRTKPRTLLHLKSNKVDPIKDENVFDENSTPERLTSRTTPDNQAAQRSEYPVRIGTPNSLTERQLNDACSLYGQKNLTPTSDNSRCYVVFKDRKGKYFCEFCAPLESKKITSRLKGTDLKLRCTNCRLHFRDRSIKTNVKLKSDTCPKYGRSQKHGASPSST